MPRAYDRRQLVVDRDPLHNLHPEISRLPKFSLAEDLKKSADQVWANFCKKVEELTGLNLSSAQGFFISIQNLIEDWLNLNVLSQFQSALTGTRQDSATTGDVSGRLAALVGTVAEHSATLDQMSARIADLESRTPPAP
jgi:hypothetical protein